MREMEMTSAQMGTVMQSMADPVILTDTQHRVIMQNKAAERFFKVPDEMTEGLVRAVEFNNLLFSAALSSMLVSGSDSHRDLTLVDAIEGEEMLFEAVSAPTFGPDGGSGNGFKQHFLARSEEHTSELQSHSDLVCRLLLE